MKLTPFSMIPLRFAHPRGFALLLMLSGACLGAAGAGGASGGWNDCAPILARIRPPVFPERNFVITDFGAAAGGTDCTAAIRKAIAACHEAGGGRVVVPAGVFVTGGIRLLGKVDLHLAEGSTLRFVSDPAAYLPAVFTRWEGTECMNYAAFIYALDLEDIAVTGTGTLDGSASDENWWGWARRGAGRKSRAAQDVALLNAMSDRGVPPQERVFGAGHYLRPNFIQAYRCRNVLIEGVSIVRSPMWEIHPVLCTNVTVRGVRIKSDGPNNDGCDPESSRDVLIDHCVFATGDDCIAIKSGRNNDGRRIGRAAENLVIRNCEMRDGHAGVAVGSEVSGGCRNVFIEDCTMDSPNLDRALRLKSNAARGGVIENIFMRRVEIGHLTEAVLTVDFLYEEGPRGPFPPVVRNIVLENIQARASPRVFFMAGFPGATIEGIRIANSTITGVTAPEVVSNVGGIELDHVDIIPAKSQHSKNSRATEPPAPSN